MFDEVKGYFRKQIDDMFFGDNEIQQVSETSFNISDPDDHVIEVTVKDKDGNLKKWKITEVK